MYRFIHRPKLLLAQVGNEPLEHILGNGVGIVKINDRLSRQPVFGPQPDLRMDTTDPGGDGSYHDE